jgi:hypothetical protein
MSVRRAAPGPFSGGLFSREGDRAPLEHIVAPA